MTISHEKNLGSEGKDRIQFFRHEAREFLFKYLVNGLEHWTIEVMGQVKSDAY